MPIGRGIVRLLVVVTVLVALASEILVESVQKAAETFGMSPAFVGFLMSVSIALGSVSQIALFVAPALVLLSYVVGPSPMSLPSRPGAITMVIATVTASFITSSGRSAWFVGGLFIFIIRSLCANAVCGSAS
jgi:Ca2+:H+ antiporter